MSRTMLNEQLLPQKFWCNTVDTSKYILNRILIRVILGKTPYELLRCKKPTLYYFRVFGSKCFILNTKDYLTKFDPKSFKGVFLGYSQNSKAYIILNKHTRKIEESLNVTFDETPPPSKTSPLVDDDLDKEEVIMATEKKNLENLVEDETLEIDEIVNIKESKNHQLENVIGNLNQRTLRSQAQNQSNFFCFISTIEPKNVNEALTDESWIVDMQEELNQFIANDVWELVPQPRNMTIIGTKWVFRNKLDENDFAQILDIPCEGVCVFTDRWSLDELAYGVPSEGPYQTNPPSPDDIILFIRTDREGQITRIRHEQEIDVQHHQILTREIVSTLKPLEEIIWENVFCLGGEKIYLSSDKANDAQKNFLYARTEYSSGNNNSSRGRGRGSYSRDRGHGRGQGSGRVNTQNHGQRDSLKNHEDNEQKGEQHEKRDLSHIKCYRCEEYGHFVSRCPERN
ncbi:retrovirus-related pol polyprotein from transposon TNT 1-94 [Tanacetum coccineum]